MTSRDEGQDRELLARYRQANDADPRAPSAAVRAAILEEGRRVAAAMSAPLAMEAAGRWRSRRKITTWGAAAAALIAALIMAPRLWNEARPTPGTAASRTVVPFNQAARKTEAAEVSMETRPVVPVMPVPGPRATDLPPSASLLADAPTLRRAVPPPPPVHIPEQSVEITPLSRATASAAAPHAPGPQPQVANLANTRHMNSRYAMAGDAAHRSAKASALLLPAAAAAGDLVKTTQLLDQGAAIDNRDGTGRTPLMLAIGQNQIAAVRLLLDRGADPNAADNQGLSPLQLAQQRKFDDIAALLLKAGAR